jgi:aldehyde:ferredoxin oxidoreductase
MQEMCGWMGKVLKIDLTRAKITREALDPEVCRNYMGARGFGIYYLDREMDPECDPLGPGNVMVLATGPLTGTRAPTGGRYMVTTKSPLTNGITVSNSGGFFPAQLKKTGWDAIIIKGASSTPVYLWIEDEKVEIRDASEIWGKSVPETDDFLKSRTDPKAKVACIGPAGENMVKFAAVMNDKHRAAGRGGLGAVMGSKRLKGVVVKGNTKINIHDSETFSAKVKQYMQDFKDFYGGQEPGLRTYGTAQTILGTQGSGALPTRNAQATVFEGYESITGTALTKKYLKGASACFSCPLACGRLTALKDSQFEGSGEGPEYETLYSMGAMCGISDLAAITKANYICNEMGFDTISAGATVACAMEMQEKGILSEKETGGKLQFGDGAALVRAIESIAERKDFGDALAEGSLRMATKYGAPELAMQVKGMEFAGYDPRGEQGMGLNYATSPIGASHMRGDTNYMEVIGVPFSMDPQSIEKKAELVFYLQNLHNIIDAAGLCVFFSIRHLTIPTLELKPDPIRELINAATGANLSMDEVTAIGERIFTLERRVLNKMGFTRKQDTLPERSLKEPVPEGPAKGRVSRLDEMLDDYYLLRGWDKDGYVSGEKLEQLGITS